MAWAGPLGSYAERVLLPADRVVAVPPGMGADTAAALMLQGMTAHYLCTDTYPLKEGRTPASSTRRRAAWACCSCRWRSGAGARVIGTVGTEAKAALAREAGADEVILYMKEDFLEAVKRITWGAASTWSTTRWGSRPPRRASTASRPAA